MNQRTQGTMKILLVVNMVWSDFTFIHVSTASFLMPREESCIASSTGYSIQAISSRLVHNCSAVLSLVGHIR